jgi:ferredoxin
MKEKFVLSYAPEAVGEPVIYRLIKHYDVMVTILRAEITPGQEGRLLLELEGEGERVPEAVAYLESLGVTCLPASRAILWKEEGCVDCGACTGVCFSGALEMDPESARLKLERELCVGCGLCVKACPFGLFSLAFED